MNDNLQRKHTKCSNTTKSVKKKGGGERIIKDVLPDFIPLSLEFLRSVHRSARKKLNKAQNSMEWSYGTMNVLGCFLTNYLQPIFILKI